MLHAAHREEFCKAAAFLDYLVRMEPAETRLSADILRDDHALHSGIENTPGKIRRSREPRRPRFMERIHPERRLLQQAGCLCHLIQPVCEEADNGDSFVILHHFFTDRFPPGPFAASAAGCLQTAEIPQILKTADCVQAAPGIVSYFSSRCSFYSMSAQYVCPAMSAQTCLYCHFYPAMSFRPCLRTFAGGHPAAGVKFILLNTIFIYIFVTCLHKDVEIPYLF